ncbi:MAG TPA: CGNR zinc finger domain-containing protein [Thermoleophilaceae bacterium]|jgi:predicted RNA-binding Zn ribbon-like protein
MAAGTKPVDNNSSRELAPGELATLQQFLNTRDLEDGIELLQAPADLRRWLTHHELVAPSTRIGSAELRRALDVREAFRAVLWAKDGGPVDRAAIETLDAAARRAELTVRWHESGEAGLAPARSGLDGAFGRLLAIAYRARVEGTWERLKVCPDDSCGWAFYDRSRNRSSTWCSMAVCGNRAKARAFRERRARR